MAQEIYELFTFKIFCLEVIEGMVEGDGREGDELSNLHDLDHIYVHLIDVSWIPGVYFPLELLMSALDEVDHLFLHQLAIF